MNEPVVIKPSDKSLLLKIRDEYVKPNAKVGTNAYLCSFLSQLADRIEQLERELNEANQIIIQQRRMVSINAQSLVENGEIAKAMHYPDCWDTMAYPTLLSAIQETAFCTECEEPIVRDSDKELSALKQQIADGELVPVEVARDYYYCRHNIEPPDNLNRGLKQFAAERAKEKVVAGYSPGDKIS